MTCHFIIGKAEESISTLEQAEEGVDFFFFEFFMSCDVMSHTIPPRCSRRPRARARTVPPRPHSNGGRGTS